MGWLSSILPSRSLGSLVRAGAALCLGLVLGPGPARVGAQMIATVGPPLLLPTGVAFDGQGNLYIAETSHQVVRRVDGAGVLTTVAGTGVQGFSGDDGLATAARLDSPAGVAVDAAGNLYIADSHNQRVRRVDAGTGVMTTVAGTGVASFAGDGGAAAGARLDLPEALAMDAGGDLYVADVGNHRVRRVDAGTGMISTVAGSGIQGFSGDGGLATAAAIDSPGGLAVDGAGNLYIADTHNQRVRVVASTGLISTVAGTGAAGFAGDGGAGGSARLALPRGLSVDAAGNVYVADANNQRVRRIAPDGTVTTVAGTGTQGFSGDGGLAVAAGLDTPRAAAVAPAGQVAVADSGNERVRAISLGGTGVGGSGAPAVLTTGASETVYGASVLTAALATSGVATGNVSFLEGTALLGSGVLAGNLAALSLPGLTAGTHAVHATYAGDPGHAAAQSGVTAAVITGAPVSASAGSVSLLYGDAVPVLSGSLTGVMAQDVGSVGLVLSTAAVGLSPVGSYPIAGALNGPGAGNYVLTPLAGAAVTIGRAPTSATVAVGAVSVAVGVPVSVALAVASATTGVPTGSMTVVDGGTLVATVPLAAGGASFTTSALGVGTHALTAAYAGDANFLGSTATGQLVAVTAPAAGDFTLAATGQIGQTVAAGSAASFSFTVGMQGAALASPIALTASALPLGATGSFSPSYLPPGGAVTAFTLTVQTSKTAASSGAAAMVFAGLLGLLLPFGWRRRVVGSAMLAGLVVMVGCGDRVLSTPGAVAAVVKIPITVSGTATGPTGVLLQHTAVVTLTVQ